MDRRLLDDVIKLKMRNVSIVIAVVIETVGSTPRKAGATMIIGDDGFISGTVGGGHGEAQIIESAKEAIKGRTSAIIEVVMDNADAAKSGMICGGKMRVFLNYIS